VLLLCHHLVSAFLTYIRRRPTEENFQSECTTRLLFRSNYLSILLEEVWIPFTDDYPVDADAHLYSMRLIVVEAFLTRESLISKGKRVDRRAKVLDFCSDDDEETEYAILSHRWVGQEVDYDEMVGLVKLAVEARDKIR